MTFVVTIAPIECAHTNRVPVEGSTNTTECLDCGLRFYEVSDIEGGDDYVYGGTVGGDLYTPIDGSNSYTSTDLPSYTIG